jgi:hypothetical protein
MKLIHFTAAVLLTAALSSCNKKTGTQGDSTGAVVPAEDGPSCTTGAGAARNRMVTGEDTKEAGSEKEKPAEGGSRLKEAAPNAPAKLGAAGTDEGTGPVPGESKEVEFEVKIKANDDATRAALDKILDKTPTVKP